MDTHAPLPQRALRALQHFLQWESSGGILLIGAALVALLFTLIAVLSLRVVWDDFRFEETSPGIGVPQWWYSMWLPVFSALIVARALGLYRRQGLQAAAEDATEQSTTGPQP